MLEKAEKKYIDSVCDKVYSEYNLSFPFDYNDFLYKTGGAVIYGRQLIEDDSCFSKLPEEEYEIYLNISPRYENTNFGNNSALSVFGCMCLHYGLITDDKRWEKVHFNQSYLANIREKQKEQSEYFVLGLTLPKKRIIDYLKKYSLNNSVDLKRMAKYFRTNTTFLLERLKSLNIIGENK